MGNDIHGAPLTTEALYPTASLTKLTVALAILRLADRGTLDLDAHLMRVLPELAAERATLRDLLCHTAGLPEMPTVTAGTWQEIGPSCLTTPPDHEPGTRVLYSNQGYGLLGIALERVTGRPFGEALRSLVIEPLGLDAHVADALPRRPVQGWKFRVLPAGGVFMTIKAALKLVEAFRNSAGRVSQRSACLRRDHRPDGWCTGRCEPEDAMDALSVGSGTRNPRRSLLTLDPSLSERFVLRACRCQRMRRLVRSRGGRLLGHPHGSAKRSLRGHPLAPSDPPESGGYRRSNPHAVTEPHPVRARFLSEPSGSGTIHRPASEPRLGSPSAWLSIARLGLHRTVPFAHWRGVPRPVGAHTRMAWKIGAAGCPLQRLPRICVCRSPGK